MEATLRKPLNDSFLEDIPDFSEPEDLPNQPSPDKGSDGLPFKRWLSTLRRRNQQKRGTIKTDVGGPEYDDAQTEQFSHTQAQNTSRRPEHRKSLSMTSSLGLITAVRSATGTWANSSIAPRSRRGLMLGHRHSDHGSSAFSAVRMSFDSRVSYEPIMDEKAWARSVQRRKIIEELMESEESYIADMKALVNVYFTLLATAPSLTAQRRKSVQNSVTQIVQLHEELLSELHKIVPNADQRENYVMPRGHARHSKHTRWRSAESAPSPSKHHMGILGRHLRHSVDAVRPVLLPQIGLVMNTSTVLGVAKVFGKFMRRFLAYEAYVAHNTFMDQDASFTSRMIPTWSAIERGVEVLATSTNSINHRDANSRKGLTFSDLLIKPIQRICKYPLFFSDLCKQTPVCDDPVAHAELQKVLFQLQETAEDINEAMDNPTTRQLIETSWLLQDRLVFEGELEFSKPLMLRQLGHVILCGVLHVTYNTVDRVNGQYMICMLYRSSLVVAVPSKDYSDYQVVAVIPLLNGSIEASDNSRGLQCYTAPFTFKLVFEFERRNYEFILSACSEKEEEEWKTHLQARIAAETRDFSDGRANTADLFSMLHLDAKALGAAFEAHGVFTRRKSIHRAATLGPKTSSHQVIIKNTYAQKTGGDEAAVPVGRSQSHLTATSHIPTLAPRRAERIRMEAAMADVWSRDILPYPGMASRRMETHIRASANSVMRKLSMASIASNFTKRSASFTNLSNRDDMRCPSSQRGLPLMPPKLVKRSTGLDKLRVRNPQPAIVDFHSTPAAFLPEDFELKPKQTLLGKRRRMNNRAATADGTGFGITPRQMTPIGAYLCTQGENRVPDDLYAACQVPLPATTIKSERSTESSRAQTEYSIRSRAASRADSEHYDENTSPPFAGHRGPVKARSLLFKFLARVKE
ncbi:hypothetical protein EJ08DRAFT_580532 [Tothia fuscella]|uniref:DH domain-containing protein n=1 Tax=Tothia fuscella TaxID=1048955 RepID=A0A9P4U340_9PEZI|nr:hypothetical protein EJ08DRAFT_580532 [Tothia fuscella]